MRRAAQLSIIVLCLAALGCQKTASERLVGKWRGVKAEGVVPDMQPLANEAAQGMEFEFTKDSIIVTPAKTKDSMSAHYAVLREDRRSVVVVSDKDGMRDEQTFTLDSDDSMRWQVLGGKTITFQRIEDGKDKDKKAKGAASSASSTP